MCVYSSKYALDILSMRLKLYLHTECEQFTHNFYFFIASNLFSIVRMRAFVILPGFASDCIPLSSCYCIPTSPKCMLAHREEADFANSDHEGNYINRVNTIYNYHKKIPENA